jgi:hypothetical protein
MDIPQNRLVNLDSMLEQNLASYLEANATVSPSTFKAARELQIARYGLEESLSLHATIVATIKTALLTLSENPNPDAKSISYLTSLATGLEDRHAKLIKASKDVAAICKMGAEIESLLSSKLDAAQIYSIVSQLPQLFLSLTASLLTQFFQSRNLSIHNGRPIALSEIIPEIANCLSVALNDELERSVNVLTYKQNSNQQQQSGFNVIESQVVAMLNSVPNMPTVVDPSDPVAKTVQSLENTEF